MRKSVLVAAFFSALLFTALAGALHVRAVSKTIIVPDDYPTITAAVGNATNGDTILIKSGTYEGPINQTIVIDKSLTVVGENAENTIIKLYPAYTVSYTILYQTYYSYSDAIAIVADGCKLLNLTVTISPSGDISATGNRIEIAGNKITTGFSVKGSYCKISNNVAAGLHLNGSFNEVSRNSLGISIEGASNIIKDNVCTALHLSHSNSNFVLGNKVGSDSRGHSGINVAWSDNNVFCRNEVSGFSFDFRLWFSSGNMIVANTIADSLAASISFGGSSNNRIYLNNFIDNPSEHKPYVYDFYTDLNHRSAHPDMTLSTNFWDNGTRGNYWENYSVSDGNGDGAGDTSYIINANNQDNFPLVAQVDISEAPVEFPKMPELPDLPAAPAVVLLKPSNRTYNNASVPLDFMVDEQAVWIGYSLDEQEIVTVAGNVTLAGLSDGVHTLTVYANDTFGFTGASETVTFTVATFPTVWITAAIIVSAAIITFGLVVYSVRRNRKRSET